jgi:NAD(P)H-flavin reductase/hemoglobin-like flavoprotein
MLLKDTLDTVAGRADELVEFFYARLFLLASVEQQPEVIAMFPLMMDGQRDRLLRSLVRIVSTAASGDLDSLTGYLAATGRDHRMISSLRAEHYALVGQALLATLAYFAGDAWTAEVAETWTEAYGLVSGTMIKAMEDDSSPRWWNASVTAIRPLSADVMSVSVQLDQPMSWRPGQSVKAEITDPDDAAPAVRRFLTPANAPGNGTWMEFHVKIIPWGLFSPAFTQHVQAGSQLKLSSPGGTLALDEHSPRPLLMLAGSTGLAPMLSMIRRLSERPVPPRVSLYFGARDPGGLYAFQELERMAAGSPWLEVTYVVEAPPAATSAYHGKHGTVVDAALHQDWHDHDIYACGPPPMVRAALTRLASIGLAQNQIHTEAFGLE